MPEGERLAEQLEAGFAELALVAGPLRVRFEVADQMRMARLALGGVDMAVAAVAV